MKLVRYKKAYHKIAMGFLSYSSGEQPVKQLQETMARYETDDSWEMYLVKEHEDLIGIVGAEVEDHSFIVQHLSINPSFRGEGIGTEMVAKLQEEFPDKTPYGNEYTEAFVSKCILVEARAER